MGGQVLEYEAKTIKREGLAEGLAKTKRLAIKLYKMGESAETIADLSELDVDLIQEWINEAFRSRNVIG